MPNIEIHGFPVHFLQPIESSDVELVVNRIEKVLQDLGLGGKAITDVVPSLARMADGSKKRTPYLRVLVSRKEAHLLDTLIPALREAIPEMEVEDLLLEHYYRSKNDEDAMSGKPEDESSGC